MCVRFCVLWGMFDVSMPCVCVSGVECVIDVCVCVCVCVGVCVWCVFGWVCLANV